MCLIRVLQICRFLRELVNLHGYVVVLTGSADDGVESAYMCENCKHGYSFLCVVLFSRMHETSRQKIHKNTCNHNMESFRSEHIYLCDFAELIYWYNGSIINTELQRTSTGVIEFLQPVFLKGAVGIWSIYW